MIYYSLTGLPWWIPMSVIVYFGFHLLEKKRPLDERESLIHLKTIDLVHRLVIGVLTVFSGLLLISPDLSSASVLVTLILASMYGEIVGRIYFRQKY